MVFYLALIQSIALPLTEKRSAKDLGELLYKKQVAEIAHTLPGSIESNRGMSSATTDENTIIFDKSELNYAIRIKKYVEDVLSKKDTCNQNTNNVADEIRKYQQLLDDGIITQEEFKNMKKKIIS